MFTENTFENANLALTCLAKKLIVSMHVKREESALNAIFGVHYT